MTAISLHPTPSPRTIAIEQFRAVGLALRKEAIFFVGALVVLGVLVIANTIRMMQTHPAGNFHTGFTYGAAGAVPIFLVAFLVPFGVWRSEDPSRRAYHLSMPVARGPHTVTKLLAGWAWMMIATAVYVAFIVLLAVVIPMITGEANELGATPGWQWMVAFTAATLAYLLTSIVVIGSDHAWRWIGGLFIGYVVLIGLFESFGMHALADALQSIKNGQYGLSAALVGATQEGHRSVTVLSPSEAVTLRMRTWIIAMPLWIIGSAIAVTIVSYRHRE